MQLVKNEALRHGVPCNLVKAIIQVESGGDPWAMRYEDHYQWLWDWQGGAWRGEPENLPSPQMVSTDTEVIQQKTSWGLFQIMGAVARELGFQRPFLSELCREEVNAQYGCLYLKKLHQRYGKEYGWEGVVAAWNAGSPRRISDGMWVNQGYVDKVKEQGGLL